MSNLAWYYSQKLGKTKDLSGILCEDIKDFQEYWYHVGIDFIDNSRIIFNTILLQTEIIDSSSLDEEEISSINKLTRRPPQ